MHELIAIARWYCIDFTAVRQFGILSALPAWRGEREDAADFAFPDGLGLNIIVFIM